MLNYNGIDQIKNFWVVTYPTTNSGLEDIFFETDIYGMHMQFAGGLKISDIAGIYNNVFQSMSKAKELLEAINK